MLESLLHHLERGAHAEDGVPPLDGDDPAGGEAPPVADAIDVVDDGAIDAAAEQEVSVKRVHHPLGRNRLGRRGERLTQNLSAEHLAPAEILAVSPEEVLLQPLERQQLDELWEYLGHQRPLGGRESTVHRSALRCRKVFPPARRAPRAGEAVAFTPSLSGADANGGGPSPPDSAGG